MAKNQRGGKRPGAGRPAGAVSRATKRQKATLSDLARAHTAAALNVLLEVAKKSDSDSARVSAANAILDRAYGKPAQSHEHSGKGGGPIQTMDVTNLSDEQLAALEAAFGGIADASSGDIDADTGGEGKA